LSRFFSSVIRSFIFSDIRVLVPRLRGTAAGGAVAARPVP
jgi:hypothetical protein